MRETDEFLLCGLDGNEHDLCEALQVRLETPG